MSRRKFNREFKAAAAKLVLDVNYQCLEVIQQLSVYPNSLYRWVSEYETYGENAFPGNGSTIYNHQAELHRLERRNQELEEEVELLKNPKSSCSKKGREVQVSGATKAPISDQEGLYSIWHLTQ